MIKAIKGAATPIIMEKKISAPDSISFETFFL